MKISKQMILFLKRTLEMTGIFQNKNYLTVYRFVGTSTNQYGESGSKLDPYSATLRIRICILNTEPLAPAPFERPWNQLLLI